MASVLDVQKVFYPQLKVTLGTLATVPLVFGHYQNIKLFLQGSVPSSTAGPSRYPGAVQVRWSPATVSGRWSPASLSQRRVTALE